MPNVSIQVGGRAFNVACADGEETYLKTAAAMLDIEASTLMSQSGRLPEATMLLMSGLMLADKAAGLEDQVSALEAQLAELKGKPATTVQVPVVPEKSLQQLADLAAQAEALADLAEANEGA